MKKRLESKITQRRVSTLFVFHTFFIVLASILTYLLVEFGRAVMSDPELYTDTIIYKITVAIAPLLEKIWPDIKNDIFSSSLGVIVPMCIVLFPININLSRLIYRNITALTQGIEEIGEGKFETRLDVSKGGLFSHAYESFNKTAEELSNVTKLKNDFINNYSHEFKTPISSISGFSKLLLERDDLTQEERNSYLKIINVEATRLADMANSTIMLSKLNNQQIVTDKTEYSLDEQIRMCIIILTQEWSKKNIEIESELETVSYNGNADMMSRLWLNLIGNAIKYTPENGEIQITLKKKNGSVTVEISDTGIGMNEETAARIFDQYYQGNTAHSEAGLGLGLPICKRITELCNGEISVKSILNEGSTFRVVLPL